MPGEGRGSKKNEFEIFGNVKKLISDIVEYDVLRLSQLHLSTEPGRLVTILRATADTSRAGGARSVLSRYLVTS